MADIEFVAPNESSTTPSGLRKKFKDMGDGTYAEVVAVGDLVVTADTVNLDTSDIEALLSALTSANHADLAAVLAKLIAAPATEAKQDALISANHTDLAAILAKLTSDPATAAGVAALLTDIVLASGTNVIGKVDQGAAGNDPWSVAPVTQAYGGDLITITRPADTTAYAANDVLGPASGSAAIELTNIGPAGGRVMITSSELMRYINAVPSGMTSFTARLYDANPPSAYADNDAWDLPSGDRSHYLGSFSLGTPADQGSTLSIHQDGINKQVKLADGSTSLWMYITTDGGFTPSSGAVTGLRVGSLGL